MSRNPILKYVGWFVTRTVVGMPSRYSCRRAPFFFRSSRNGPQLLIMPILTLCDPVTYDIDVL